jgi:hypothetical protein
MIVNKIYFDAFNKGELVIDFGNTMSSIAVWNFRYTLFPELDNKDLNHRYFFKKDGKLIFSKKKLKTMKSIKTISAKELSNINVKKDVLPLPIL